MPKNFKPLACDVQNVGKHIKSTKKRFLWRFELDLKEHEIILYLSKLSGKRKILLNGDIHSNEKKSSSTFGSYPLRIGAHSLLVFEIDDNKFDLRVDNLSFEATFNSKMLNSGLSYDNPFAEEKSPYEIQDSHRLIKKSRNESPDYTRKASPEPPRRLASRTAYKAPEPAEEPRKKEEARPAEVPKPQPQAPPRAPEPAPLEIFSPCHSPLLLLPRLSRSIPLKKNPSKHGRTLVIIRALSTRTCLILITCIWGIITHRLLLRR